MTDVLMGIYVPSNVPMESTPFKGMEFEANEIAYAFYNEYGIKAERAEVYVKLHLRKVGTPVNTEAESNIEKINELLSESSNRVQSSDLTGSIAWAPDDVYAQVFGNEHNSRVRGVGFGPTPSMHPAKSTPAIAHVRSQERDAKVTQLENQVTSLTEKVNRYENLEERMTQLMQLVQNQQNHSSEASQVNVSELGLVTPAGKVVWGKYAQVPNNPENDGCLNAVLLV
ncbi:uncharacterized protein LOC115994472 [Quercus lobata]|uniref:uncharacterized protein LOC115994472 n=1 Tax=Quercus lobata TaxID=97700 RepID=UPI001245E44A|nr:uncharacterized protein LOC115994472 [Quercus lobata]